MIIVAAIAFDRHTTFPGMAALVPVVGTVLVLACGNESRIASGLLRTRPLQWFGDVSYVWYLWHWPVLVFADVLVPDLTVAGRIGFGLLSLAIAGATRGLLEDRIRFAPWFVARPAMTIGLTAALTMGNASGTALWSAGAGEASASAAQARFTQARDDNPVLYADGCHLDYEHVTSPECVFGDPLAATTVVLFGDSHAAHWFPALERIASEERWRLVSLTKSGCPSVDVAIRDLRIGRRYVECETWRHNSLARKIGRASCRERV